MGIVRELRDQYIAAGNRKPPWSEKAFVPIVREIEHHDVVSSGIFPDEFHDKCPRAWMKKALNTLEEPMEAYMVEVIADSHF